MQQLIATLLTCCLLFNVACSENTYRQNRSTTASVGPKPKSSPAPTSTLSVPTPAALQNSAQYKILRDVIVAAASKGQLFIKDANGMPVSMEAYEMAPDKYYLLFSDNGKNLALRSGVVPQAGTSNFGEKITVKVEINKIPSLIDFSEAKITEILVNETITLGLTPAATANNTLAINGLVKKIKQSTELAADFNSKGILQKISDFLFPTAYADSETLMYVAIGISIAAGISVLLALGRYTGWVGAALLTIATAVMWTLYFIEKNKEDDDAAASGSGAPQALASCEVANFNNTTPATKICAQFDKFAPGDNAPQQRKTDCESEGGAWFTSKNCSSQNSIGVCHPSLLDGEEAFIIFYTPQTPAQGKIICETELQGIWEP